MRARRRWQRTSPLAALFFFGRIFRFISQNAAQSVAPLAALIFATEGSLLSRVGFAVALALAILTAVSVLSYWFFRYRITDDSILIREGIFRKTQLDIKFDRIQAINTRQNVIYRQFGLVTMVFDTAGSARQEGNLPAVPTALAETLRERIRHRGISDELSAADTVEPAVSRPLLSLNNADMVRIGLSDNRALIFLALLGPLLDQLDARIEALIQTGAFNVITGGAAVTLATGTMIALTVGVGILAFLMIASILGAFMRFQHFSLVADGDVLRSAGGLLTRHEHSMNLNKMQSLEALQNPVLRVFRRFRLRAKQASSGKPGRNKHFIIPLCDTAQLDCLGREAFRDEFPAIEMQPRSPRFQPVSVRYFRSRLLLYGVLPLLPATGLAFSLVGLPALVLIAWLPFIATAAWIKYRKMGFYVDANGIVLRRGFVGIRSSAFIHRKVQRISVTQSLLQKRRGLATVRFYLASGSLRMPYVDYDLAKSLRDFILYRVESSKLAWH